MLGMIIPWADVLCKFWHILRCYLGGDSAPNRFSITGEDWGISAFSYSELDLKGILVK